MDQRLPPAATEVRAEAFSYAHPESGEWAHARGHDLFLDSWRSYLEPAWPQLCRRLQGGERPLRVAEVGFGRGFNVALCARRWRDAGIGPAVVEALAFEAHPEWLEPWPPCPPSWRAWMPWWGQPGESWTWPDGGHLRRLACPAESRPWPGPPRDLIILDLFSPGRHPQSWSPALFARLRAAATAGTIVTSYSCARLVREGLQEVGFEVQRLRRPGWRDTLLAQWPATSATLP